MKIFFFFSFLFSSISFSLTLLSCVFLRERRFQTIYMSSHTWHSFQLKANPIKTSQLIWTTFQFSILSHSRSDSIFLLLLFLVFFFCMAINLSLIRFLINSSLFFIIHYTFHFFFAVSSDDRSEREDDYMKIVFFVLNFIF
jgi:hypothetical protein